MPQTRARPTKTATHAEQQAPISAATQATTLIADLPPSRPSAAKPLPVQQASPQPAQAQPAAIAQLRPNTLAAQFASAEPARKTNLANFAPALAATQANSPPAPISAPSALPAAQTLPSQAAQSLPEARPAALMLSQSPPQATPVTAALAFQGQDMGAVDPVSLAAFQSFTRPGDLAARSANLRDGLEALLSAVPCARLQVAFNPETATLELRGHLPEAALRAPVLAALQAQMGRDIALKDSMRLLPRPQCGALSGISAVGLPQSTDQITNPLLLGTDAQARVLAYSGGEQLFFELTAPDYPAYIYVDYFDAAGDVIHLSPNGAAPLRLAPAKSAQRVGARTPEEPGLQITIGPPYGQEIAVAFAASAPLYQAPRPINEPAAAYLDFLRERIALARKQATDFKGEWVYFLIETTPR
ncbi:DUF4384 domain-containing protein [Pseudophaeobacter flagellatus]|uniref:DUF4384 domain-containing protein n=1 Tax=Pseudophaeobacter flagellatus TaxID=2899119 RepID=UPI001E64CE6B|nr:DUF4384 domain-containing protein [Pseudophaeobacter flagellatus]MCD9149667.1 DUF4384 domain-containing protein [Pseudophaeobacter flagellatus]